MPDPEDILDVEGIHAPGGKPRSANNSVDDSKPKWKSVWFQCCHTYGRIYRNPIRTKYEGSCPKCGAKVQTLIGPSGTNKNIFRAQ